MLGDCCRRTRNDRCTGLFIRKAGQISRKIRGIRVAARFVPKLDGKRIGASSCRSARRRVRAQFKINTEANSITPLTARTFGELGFKERGNLQEWIAKEPSCLGEELLVIPEGSLARIARADWVSLYPITSGWGG